MIEAISILFFALIFVVIWAAIISLPVMLLWNWTITVIFGLPEISWFQAWAIIALISILGRFMLNNKKDENR